MTLAVDLRMIRASGVGAYIRRTVIPALERLEGHHLLLLGDPTQLPDLPNSEVIPYDLPMYSMRHHVRLPLVLRGRAQALWTPHFNAPALGRLIQIATIHDCVHIARPEFFGSRSRYLVSRWWYGTTLRRARRVITVSEFSRKELSRLFPQTQDKLIAIHNALDPAWPNYEARKVPYDRPYILTVGNIKPHKNLRCLVRAFDLVLNDLDLDLVIVGQAEGMITGDKEIAELIRAGSDRIHFPGYVDGDLLKSLYAEARYTVFPSHYEGFGFGPLESMALGTPAIVSDIPPAHEACGDAAIYFDPNSPEALANTLRRLVPDEAFRLSRVVPGLERARKFMSGRSVELTVDVLRSVLA